LPANSRFYHGEAVVCGGMTLRARGARSARVEATIDGYRVIIAGGKLFAEHEGHKPWFSPEPLERPAIIRVGQPPKTEMLDTG
jgi:hypothetical protein